MITMDVAQTLPGRKLTGQGGEDLGTIDTLYADRDGGGPTFATVHTGLFGKKTSFVPLTDAQVHGDAVEVPYDKDTVKNAPSIDPDTDISPEEEQQIYAHYGVGDDHVDGTSGGGTSAAPTGQATTGTVGQDTGTVGHDTSGPNTDDAMTRSEERLHVGTEQLETGRARLHKFVTTEMQTQTVPVSREEVRVVREPITEGNAGQALDGPALSEEDHEVVLHEERPVVSKETVPVERVRLDTETVAGQAEVSEEVRKEQIETEGAGGTSAR